jgi:hypothetical protein
MVLGLHYWKFVLALSALISLCSAMAFKGCIPYVFTCMLQCMHLLLFFNKVPMWCTNMQEHPDFRQAESLLAEVDERVIKQGLVGLGVGAGVAAVVGIGLGLLLGGQRRR